MLFTRIPTCFQGTEQDQERFPCGWWVLPAVPVALLLWAVTLYGLWHVLA